MRADNEIASVQAESPKPDRIDDTHEMLQDILAGDNMEDVQPFASPVGVDELQKLLEENEKDLYEGCKEFSRLSFLIRLYHLKTISGMANKYFDMLLDLLRKVIPSGNESIPENHYQAKKIIATLGFSYEKIDACPNDCVLYRKEHAKLDACPICKLSRWEMEKSTAVVGVPYPNPRRKKTKKVAAKILRYFPITKRLQTLFISKDIAKTYGGTQKLESEMES